MRFFKYLAATAVSLTLGIGAASATTVDLGFGIDESGSISGSNFALQRDGLAAALALIPIPQDPTDPVYRVSIVTFAGSAGTLVTPTKINTVADRNAIITAVNNNTQSGGFTAIGEAIKLLTNNFVNSADGLSATSILNIGTDGVSNSGATPQDAAAFAKSEGVSSLSFEAVGNTSTAAILDAAFAADPDAVLINDPADLPSDILQKSFVLQVDSFLDYEAAIKAKVRQAVDSTGGGNNVNPIPLPAAGWMLLIGLGGLASLRRRS